MTNRSSATPPSLPTGYDTAKYVPGAPPNCQVTVGFDSIQGSIPQFLVQLHYQVATDPVQWVTIARMDHNETATQGHDIYVEGLHADVARRTSDPVTLHPSHGPLPSNTGIVVRGCVNYIRDEADYFIDVYEERRPPGSPPRWSPDGGTPTFIRVNSLEGCMSRESHADDYVTDEELTELLAEATDSTSEEIERGAAELEIGPLEEATIVDEE